MSEHARAVTDATFETQVLAESHKKVVMVDFWAEWCGPCRRLAPTVEEVAKDFAGKAMVLKVNVDDHPSLAQRFNVRSIPTLLFFKDEEVVDQVFGCVPKSDIVQTLEKHIGA
ncbi:MAG: thioredoxin [bacterium]|nr:thioredoxin [bacterium]